MEMEFSGNSQRKWRFLIEGRKQRPFLRDRSLKPNSRNPIFNQSGSGMSLTNGEMERSSILNESYSQFNHSSHPRKGSMNCVEITYTTFLFHVSTVVNGSRSPPDNCAHSDSGIRTNESEEAHGKLING
ncbi:hypothetical protein JTE90_011532 [Oedothorax gibbosus]|uniref:Uncharacterized protein n=1 Tax=Oedothorax gibbosus TaxID=931172 RepID=A0AAV6UIV7_9ARAC|nr:hypothetical protein JTE90_011532 [Oedothorax gibbosus]